MAGDDQERFEEHEQERFEDYLELEHYIEELQAGHIAHPPEQLTPTQARIYRMAALFRSASSEESQPRPEFATELQARLEQELQNSTKKRAPHFLRRIFSKGPQDPLHTPKQRSNVSRRSLLTRGAAVAASLVVGAGIGASIEKQLEGTPADNSTPKEYNDLVINGTGNWLAVTTLSALGTGAIRFSTDAIVGYVIRTDSDDRETGPVIAVSAACTHMGCIVHWQDTDQKFHCPCHGGLFTKYGQVDQNASPIRYINALPRLKTKVENDTVFVEVPGNVQYPSTGHA